MRQHMILRSITLSTNVTREVLFARMQQLVTFQMIRSLEVLTARFALMRTMLGIYVLTSHMHQHSLALLEAQVTVRTVMRSICAVHEHVCL